MISIILCKTISFLNKVSILTWVFYIQELLPLFSVTQYFSEYSILMQKAGTVFTEISEMLPRAR